jgi:hypothetical protein
MIALDPKLFDFELGGRGEGGGRTEPRHGQEKREPGRDVSRAPRHQVRNHVGPAVKSINVDLPHGIMTLG